MVEKTVENILRGGMFRQLIEQEMSEFREEYHLKKIEMEVLFYLARSGEYNTAVDIRRFLLANKGHISQAVDTLCKKNLLVGKVDEKDRRYVHYFLTASAVEITNMLEEHWEKITDGLFEGVSKEDKEAFHRVAKQVRKNMESFLKIS